MPTDPVCRIVLCKENNTITSRFLDRRFFFCSDSCREAFEEEPERYVLAEAVGADFFKSVGLE